MSKDGCRKIAAMHVTLNAGIIELLRDREDKDRRYVMIKRLKFNDKHLLLRDDIYSLYRGSFCVWVSRLCLL